MEKQSNAQKSIAKDEQSSGQARKKANEQPTMHAQPNESESKQQADAEPNESESKQQEADAEPNESESKQQAGTKPTEPLYQIGIDCGSKTVKVCISDRDSHLIHSVYRRHRSNIKVTLSEIIHELNWRYGDIRGTVAITGSAGISVAEALGLPFVQEVVATTKIVKKEYPQADCVIELGGEDAKVVYLTGGVEQRMNATCAGGTGGFIDNIAYLLGVRTADMDKLSLGATRSYPIASRCAVFAQTDIRPLMNAGARSSDLAGSTLDAVVRQTLGGLACGRPITGTVIFLGGPFEFLSDLAVRFRKALGLTSATGIRPADAQFFTARGAGLYGATLAEKHIASLQELEEQLKTAHFHDEGLQRLPPLFNNTAELEEFKTRHARNIIERESIFSQKGPVYVGIDAGSTAVKIAVINQQGTFIWGESQENHGDVLETTAQLLRELYTDFPHEYRGPATVYVAHTVATGYGEDMLKACLGVDSGVVETTAHVQGALSFAPNASFVLDIGGQDMKAIWVKDGLVQNAILNEACSSGCGSFLSGTAYSLRLPKESFSEAALSAENPVDLGTKCTVFMNSRLKHAQKVGASTSDLAAGCAYSVVKNALFRIIGLDNLDSLGDCIVVQGGTFMNDAVLCAFELLAGKQVLRPNRAHLMGALGAAFVARKRALAQPENAHSTLISREELAHFSPKRTTRLCEGCANSCTLSVVTLEPAAQDPTVAAAGDHQKQGGSARSYIGGNRCGKALELYAANQRSHASGAPNAVAVQRALLERIPDCEGSGKRAQVHVGIMNTLLTYEYVPFWHEFFHALGFSVCLPRESNTPHFRVDNAGSDTIPSESACYPAKLSHRRLNQLSQAGATHVFMPHYRRGSSCPVATEYVCALQDGASLSLEIAHHMINPALPYADPRSIAASAEALGELRDAIAFLAASVDDDLLAEEFDAAIEQGLAAQTAHESTIRKANEKALAWVASDKRHHGVLLLGRPYHTDSATGHRIDEVLSHLGFAVLSPNVITRDDAPRLDSAADGTTWEKSSRALRLARYALDHKRIDVVALYSFGCLYDGINILDTGDYLRKHGRLFTALKVDEIADTAHLRIRLRTLAENIEQMDLAAANLNEPSQSADANRRAHASAPAQATAAPSPSDEENINSATDDAIRANAAAAGSNREKTASEKARISEESIHAQQSPTACFSEGFNKAVVAAQAGDVAAFCNLEPADIETARAHTRDLCYTTAAIVGRSLRIMQACPHLKRLTLPKVCQKCVLDTVPFLIRRAAGKDIDITWENDWPTNDNLTNSQCKRVGGAGQSGRESLVGIIGTAPLVFDSYLNDNLVSLIEEQGCTPVFPQLSSLFTDDVRYLDQLQRFYDRGVRNVIYLQSFGCLKGHVHVRGDLHALAARFPNMNIVVLDYDPEASALNRENRVLLALSAALGI